MFLQGNKMRIGIHIPGLLHRPDMFSNRPFFHWETQVGQRLQDLVVQQSSYIDPFFVQFVDTLVQVTSLAVASVPQSVNVCFQRLDVLFGYGKVLVHLVCYFLRF